MIIGITGNTGSGKTYISSILKNMGAYIINADKIYHESLLTNKNMTEEIVNFFGREILDKNKNIDRKKLSKIVFKNKDKLNSLNKITHKYIIEDIKKNLENNKKKYKYIVLDVPILIETNLNKLCDKVWLIYADENIRIDRIIKRDKISKEEAIERINSQTKFEDLKDKVDMVIENKNGENLEEYIKFLLKEK